MPLISSSLADHTGDETIRLRSETLTTDFSDHDIGRELKYDIGDEEDLSALVSASGAQDLGIGGQKQPW